MAYQRAQMVGKYFERIEITYYISEEKSLLDFSKRLKY